MRHHTMLYDELGLVTRYKYDKKCKILFICNCDANCHSHNREIFHKSSNCIQHLKNVFNPEMIIITNRLFTDKNEDSNLTQEYPKIFLDLSHCQFLDKLGRIICKKTFVIVICDALFHKLFLLKNINQINYDCSNIIKDLLTKHLSDPEFPKRFGYSYHP